MIPITPAQLSLPLKSAVVLALGAMLFGYGYSKGQKAGQGDLDRITAEYVKAVADSEDRIKQAELEVQKLQHTYTQQTELADKQKRERDRHVKDTKDRIIADLRSGSLRMRKHWSDLPADSTCGAEATARGDDESADLRAAGAGDFVRVGAAADAQVTWLQSELVATRLACGASDGRP